MGNLTKKLILATVTLPFMMGAASAFAEAPPGHLGGPKPPMCRPDMMVGLDPHMMRELHFSEVQQKELRAFRLAEIKEMRAIEIDHEKRLNSLLNADKFDKVAARELATAMESTRIDRKVAMLERQYKILHILTPEQKAEYMKLKREHRHQCEEKMRHRLAKEHGPLVY